MKHAVVRADPDEAAPRLVGHRVPWIIAVGRRIHRRRIHDRRGRADEGAQGLVSEEVNQPDRIGGAQIWLQGGGVRRIHREDGTVRENGIDVPACRGRR